MLSFPLRTLVSTLFVVPLILLPACQKKNSGSSPPPPPTGPGKTVTAPTNTVVVDPKVAGPIFQQVCQAAGGQQRPAVANIGTTLPGTTPTVAPGATTPSAPSVGQPTAPGATTAIACDCGGTLTTLDQFMQGDYKTDSTGHTFQAKCSSQRGQAPSGTNPINYVPPTAPGTSPISPANQQAARQIFANACRGQSSAGAFYFDESAGAAEPQCLCGNDTTTLSYFLADSVAGYLANPSDQSAQAFVNACRAAINASNIANGVYPSTTGTLPGSPRPIGGGCDCHNENDFPTCDGCVIHNWCVLRDASGNLISYTDRTAVSDGLANDDCSNDCNVLASNFGGGRCRGL